MTRGARQSARQGIDVFLVIPPCMEHTKCRAGLRRIKIGVEVVITPPQSAMLGSIQRRLGAGLVYSEVSVGNPGCARSTADWTQTRFTSHKVMVRLNRALRLTAFGLRQQESGTKKWRPSVRTRALSSPTPLRFGDYQDRHDRYRPVTT